MTQLDEIAINARIRDLLHRHGVDDAGAAAQLARVLSRQRLSGEELTPEAVRRAFRTAGTAPYRRFGIRADALSAEISDELRKIVPPHSLRDALVAFKKFAIRHLALDIPPNDEGPCRSHLQAFLATDFGAIREVPTGRGRTDLVVVSTGDVIEVKLWRDQTYFDDGLDELAEYLRTEDKERGYYVVFDFSGKYLSEGPKDATHDHQGKTIDVVWVHMPVVAPSKLGRTRRSNARGLGK